MILYADDDTLDLEVFNEIADDLEVDTLTFKDGDRLLEQLKNPPPEAKIVLLDINMPKKSGIEVLEEIRSSENFQQLPIVMFSTTSDEGVVKRCFEAGANLFLTKSSDFKMLKNSLKHVFELDYENFVTTADNFYYVAG